MHPPAPRSSLAPGPGPAAGLGAGSPSPQQHPPSQRGLSGRAPARPKHKSLHFLILLRGLWCFEVLGLANTKSTTSWHCTSRPAPCTQRGAEHRLHPKAGRPQSREAALVPCAQHQARAEAFSVLGSPVSDGAAPLPSFWTVLALRGVPALPAPCRVLAVGAEPLGRPFPSSLLLPTWGWQ